MESGPKRRRGSALEYPKNMKMRSREKMSTVLRIGKENTALAM